MHIQTQAISKMSKAKRAELLARTYVLHIVPERAPSVSRTVELLATQTLADLHQCIKEAFALGQDHLYAFFMSGRPWDRSTSYEGPGRNAERVTLQSVGCKPGKEFLYIFDFGDELRHSIRVESQGTRAPDQSYPRTLSAVGEAPPQYPPGEEPEDEEDAPEVDADLLPLADEAAQACAQMLRMLDSGEACEICDREPHHPVDLEASAAWFDLEERLRRALQERPQQVAAFEAHCEYALCEWLSDVLFDLAEAGCGDDALERYAAWRTLFGEDAEDHLGSEVKLLLRAGYPERAKAEAEQRLQSEPDDFYALATAADAYRECGDLERAETLSRRHYELAQEAAEPEELWAAGQQLAEVLRARGKTEEAAELELSVDDDVERAWEEQEEEAEETEEASIFSPAAALPVEERLTIPLPKTPPKTPKVGRNQPCPCGSGKKYKKCCGA